MAASIVSSSSVSSSTSLPTTLSVATRPAQPSPTQTLETHTISLFNAPTAATATAVPEAPVTADPPHSTHGTPNFSKPVLGALLGGIIAIAVFVIIMLIRRKLMHSRRRRADSARSRAAVLQMQMDEANGVTRRAVFGDLPGNRASTYSYAASYYSYAGSSYNV